MRTVALLLLLAAPATAQDLMMVEEFEAWSTGQTLDYFIDGVYWGSEQHLAGRRTRDADAGGDCLKGLWFPKGEAICFVYQAVEGEHCWHFWRDGSGVWAEFADNPSAPAAQVRLSDAPVACQGPKVGV
jgi:hypothetical protein